MSFDPHTAKTKPRLLTVAKSVKNLPMIVLSGAWFDHWGFKLWDRLAIYFVGAGHMLIKAEPVSESVDGLTVGEPAFPPITALPVLKNRKPRSLAISLSYRDLPQVRIAGAWVREWGMNIGDRVCVTPEAYGILGIRTVMRAAEWQQIQKNKELDREGAKILSMLKQCKEKYPEMFKRMANGNKKPAAPPQAAKLAQPSLREQLMAATREYNAAIAARASNLFASN